jgi:hypothetical protein
MESAMDYPRSINSQWLFCDKPRSSASSIQLTSLLLIAAAAAVLLLARFQCSSL